MHDARLVRIVERFTTRLDDAGIAWCVLRNYETFPYPRSDTSDLDILVACSPQRSLEFLQEIIGTEAISIGSVFTKSDESMKGIFLCLPGQPSLHLDFMQCLSWNGMRLVDERQVLATRVRRDNACVPMPGCEAAVSLLDYLLHRGQVKPAYRARIQQQVIEDRAGFVTCLEPVWGNEQAQALAERAAAGDWDGFAAWVESGKRHLIHRLVRHPLDLLRVAGRTAATLARRMVAPTGLWVAFMGPDGAGKTTVAEAYRARLSTLFDAGHRHQFHWRPRWLPAPGRLAGHSEAEIVVEDPHGKPPRGRLVSLLRFGYFWLDFVLGHWVRVRPLLVRRNLVSFDRCYFDFLVDPRRFRLQVPRWLLRLFASLVPQPDLIFVLDAPASVLRARKQELGQDEIAAQLDALRALVERQANMHTVNVDRDVPAIVEDLEHMTLEFLDRRERRRLGWQAARFDMMEAQR